MEQLDYGFRSGHKSVVYDAIRKNCSHWDAPVRQPLRGADEIGFHSKIVGSERRAEPLEPILRFVVNVWRISGLSYESAATR